MNPEQYDEQGRPYAQVKPKAPYGTDAQTPPPREEAPPVQKPEIDQASLTPSGVSEQEYADFIQKNQAYYLPKFCLRGGKLGWNWSALFLGPFWLAYRKMYALAALWIFILMLTNIFGAVALALVANRLYYLQATKFIAMQKISQQTAQEQRIRIIRAGGTLF